MSAPRNLWEVHDGDSLNDGDVFTLPPSPLSLRFDGRRNLFTVLRGGVPDADLTAMLDDRARGNPTRVGVVQELARWLLGTVEAQSARGGEKETPGG